jgi:hypothetical protein
MTATPHNPNCRSILAPRSGAYAMNANLFDLLANVLAAP